jgi:hypothetical protein
MRPEILALVVPIAFTVRYLKRRRPAVRTDAAEVLRWWGLGRGMIDSRNPAPVPGESPETGFDPLDTALGMQMLRPAEESESLSVAVPSHAITLRGSSVFHTGERQLVHAAVEGALSDDVRGTVMLVTCERRDENGQDWLWLCDLTMVAVEGVKPRGPGLLLRRRTSGGGAPVAVLEGYTRLSLESAELDELYDVRIAAGCNETAAREALTPAMIAWLCERAPESLVVETGGASVRLATAALLSSDEELDAFTADACWLAHAFVDGAPRQAQAA